MTYQVLARKWRPQDFASLIGQGPIVQGLRNALREGRIAQAYLFSGIRGVGKTTAARVFAKALNCERGPAEDPCNDCAVCHQITAGGDLDVLEVDAATYSKVEQIRDLTESLKYGPTRDRYKVVVLDEVHRLSRQAFDALLKIVEEPPPRLVFIFATTEVDAVPATILSRCQEFHFRRVTIGELAAHLAEICRAESIVASPAALRLVARAGEGSVRDSVALLDQLATFGGGTIDDQEVARLLGGLDTALFGRLLQAILAGDAATVSALAGELEMGGQDPRHAFAQFLAYCRDALHLAQGADPEAVDLPVEEARALQAQARGAGHPNLLRLLHLMLHSEPLVRRSEVPALAVEICWLRAAELPTLLALETLIAGGSLPAGASLQAAPAPRMAAAASPPVARTATAAPPATSLPPPATAGPAAAVPTPPPAPATRPAAAPQSTLASGGSPLAILLEGIARRRATLAAQLEEAGALDLVDGELLITAPAGDPFFAQSFEREANRAALDAALLETCGPSARWRLKAAPAGAVGSPRPVASPPPSTAEVTAVTANSTVQAVLDIFGGTITRVEAIGPPTTTGEDELDSALSEPGEPYDDAPPEDA
jgi:DNA polymerase-3 subunit gamma/tau